MHWLWHKKDNADEKTVMKTVSVMNHKVQTAVWIVSPNLTSLIYLSLIKTLIENMWCVCLGWPTWGWATREMLIQSDPVVTHWLDFDFQVIITSSGDEKAELSQKILDVLYATEVWLLSPSYFFYHCTRALFLSLSRKRCHWFISFSLRPPLVQLLTLLSTKDF